MTGFGGAGLAVTTPLDLWVALSYWSFLAALGLASAIRAVRSSRSARTTVRRMTASAHTGVTRPKALPAARTVAPGFRVLATGQKAARNGD